MFVSDSFSFGVDAFDIGDAVDVGGDEDDDAVVTEDDVECFRCFVDVELNIPFSLLGLGRSVLKRICFKAPGDLPSSVDDDVICEWNLG